MATVAETSTCANFWDDSKLGRGAEGQPPVVSSNNSQEPPELDMRTYWRQDSSPPDVLYTYYPFFTTSNLYSLTPTTCRLLETEGCLHLPLKDHLDQFVELYFLYVHPFLPMLDVAVFMTIYQGGDASGTSTSGIPLLFIRALLFATCNLVNDHTVKALGFRTIRECRADLYHRAKLLYDSGAESSGYWKCQAALLLSYWTPRYDHDGQRPNTCWLSTAIAEARMLGAHAFDFLETESEQHKQYKKLWWSCIVRDRMLCLGLGRDMQIGGSGDVYCAIEDISLPTQMELEDCKPGLIIAADNEMKHTLAQIAAGFMRLCAIMTDLLDQKRLIREQPKCQQDWALVISETEKSRTKLGAWYEVTLQQVSIDITCDTPCVEAEGSGRASIMFHCYVMYMYYLSAAILLCEMELLAFAAMIPNEIPYTFLRNSHMRRIFDDLENAISKFTKCMNGVMRLGLSRWLPISLVAYTAKPLAFNILYTRAQQELRYPCKVYGRQATDRQNELNILIQSMKQFREKFDGVESTSAVIRDAVNQAQLYEMDEPYNGHRVWSESLSTSPDVYLRLALTIDLSLEQGRQLPPKELSERLEELQRDFLIGS